MDQLRGQLRLPPPARPLPVFPSGGTGSVAYGSPSPCAGPLLLVLMLATACQSAPRASENARDGRETVAPARVIDSILPLEEEIRRFTAISPPQLSLSNGAHSREELVSQWALAVAASDSVSLARLHITPGEFIGLYYPNSVYTSPPTGRVLRWCGSAW